MDGVIPGEEVLSKPWRVSQEAIFPHGSCLCSCLSSCSDAAVEWDWGMWTNKSFPPQVAFVIVVLTAAEGRLEEPDWLSTPFSFAVHW